MDLVIPLKLNHTKKVTQKPVENDSQTETTSPTKSQVLGREQAKKRLLAFAQQWNRTKDLISTDRALYKVPNSSGALKYTYLVQGVEGKELSFPAHLIQYTKTHPPVSYCENLHYAQGVYQSRKEMLEAADEDTKRIMYFIMNSGISYCQTRDFPGRYRKWYADKKSFIGKNQENSQENKGHYSPNWESDSDDELNNYPDPTNPFTPIPVKPPDVQQKVSKIKINHIELPFFEEEDFLEGITTATEKAAKQKQALPLSNDNHPVESQLEELLAFPSCPANVDPKEDKASGKETLHTEQQDPSSASDITENRGIKRRASTPDWEEQWRTTMSKARHGRFNGTRPRSPLSPGLENNVVYSSMNYVKNEPSWKSENEVHSDDGSNSRDIESKRISLDERLELELGIKVEPSEPLNASHESPVSNEYQSTEITSFRRRAGFGPKAAPMGAVVFTCPKALPPAPYIPPHMQNLANLPLVRTVAPAKEILSSLTAEDDLNNDPTSSTPTTPDQKKRKDWDKELRNLEIIASNLEGADETILQNLEEKLLQFESSLLPSGNDSPSPTSESQNGERKKLSKRSKRPITPPITFKEPGKGILVMPRVTLLSDGEINTKKAVVFADSVRPGYGTSSEEEDERARSPPLSQAPLPVVLSPDEAPKKVKKKKMKNAGRDFDPVYDLLPAPPPPPGSPPPHLPQGRSPTPLPTSPRSPCIGLSLSSVANSPIIETGA